MKRPSLTVAVIGLVLMLFGGYAMASDVEFTGEKAIIEEVIETSIGWALEKDTVALFNSVAHDQDFFYFSPDNASTVSGFEMFKQFTRDAFMGDNFKALWFKTKEMAINVSRSGDVAWYHCLLDDVGLWNGQEAGWYDCRWTGVLEKRDGKWVIVQMHFSFPTDRASDKEKEEAAADEEGKE